MNTASLPERHHRKVRHAGVLLVAVLAAAAGGAAWRLGGAGPALPPPGPDVAARVNGEDVTRSEVDRLVTAPAERVQLLRPELAADPAALERMALEKLVDWRLLLQEATRRGIAVSDEEVDREVLSLRKRFADLARFAAWMRDRGLDEGSLFGNVRNALRVARARAALVADVRVPFEELQRYQAEHAAELREESVRLQIIVVASEQAAQEVMSELMRGAEFGGVARRRSLGGRAARGGDTGFVDGAALDPAVREVVRTLQPGQWAGPVEHQGRHLVVRLHERRPGRERTLEQARAEIERRLLPARQHEALLAWLEERRRGSRIEVFGTAPLLAARAR